MKIVWQFSKYGSVAALSALSDYAVFSVLIFFSADELLAQVIARLCGGVTSFSLNKNWSFNSKKTGKTASEARRFTILFIVNYLNSIALFYYLTSVMDFPVYPSKIGTDVFCFLINFVVMKSYVFIHGDKPSPKASP